GRGAAESAAAASRPAFPLRAGAARLDSRPDARPGRPRVPARAGERAARCALKAYRLGAQVPRFALQDDVTRHFPAVASGLWSANSLQRTGAAMPRSSFRKLPG